MLVMERDTPAQPEYVRDVVVIFRLPGPCLETHGLMPDSQDAGPAILRVQNIGNPGKA